MKLCKSFLNPIRATRNGGTASLSFFRRRCSSSCRGQPSPQLPTASGKRKGGGTAADNPEPSSPKVTCVGQVRVKSNRRGRKHRRSLSQRRMGEASFRRAEQLQRKNQRWVHLPVSALREFGSDFTCVLFPCCCFNGRLFKSECCCTNHDNNNPREENGGCGCAAILGRWLVCGNQSEEIMAVAGVGDAEDDEAEGMCVEICSRQHVFDNIEVRNGRIEVRGRSVEVEEEEEERGTVSICVPPKNALLLMRCRSDPTKMAALANRYCNCEYTKHEYIEEEEEEDEDSKHVEEGKFESEIVFEDEMKGLQQDLEVSFKLSEEKEEEIQMEVEPELKNSSEEEEVNDYEEQDEEMKAQDDDEDEEEIESNISPFEALLDHVNLSSNYQEKVEETHLSPSAHSERKEENEKGEETEQWTQQEDEEKENIETPNLHEPKNHKQLGNSKKEEEEEDEGEEEESKEVLPDCLLLMMCEPKLSMEVSKETWVRGADFIRWFPEKPRKADKSAAGCEHYHPKGRPPPAAEPKPKNPIPAPPTRKKYGLPHQLLQPPRSSCSLPSAATSMANGTELGLGPISLPRCKSEPMRMAAEKLAPD